MVFKFVEVILFIGWVGYEIKVLFVDYSDGYANWFWII